ncbi:MAG: glycoside hydrolase family 95 protein [Bacteroidales bacterium]|nr:glycoside hydrolase family 95 protein [Bacteroidales bacterium]
MKKIILSILFISILLSCKTNNKNPEKTENQQPIEWSDAIPTGKSYVLWYDHPAIEWTDALPVGNGRIGAMMFGKTGAERIQLNEESLWGGSHISNDNPGALKNLPEIRSLILEGKIPQAFELADKNISGIPGKLRSFQTLGDIYLVYDDTTSAISDYRRELDLVTGVQHITYKKGDALVECEIFASAPDDIIAVKMTSSVPGPLDMTVHLERERDAEIFTSGNALNLRGQIVDEDVPELGPGGAHMKYFASLFPARYNGVANTTESSLVFKGGTELILLFSAATDYKLQGLDYDRNIDPEAKAKRLIQKADALSWDQLKTRHISDHSSLFNRVSITLNEGDSLDKLPTDERLARFKKGAVDHGLICNYFQYGRYLLMGSSRAPGQLPANLQGLWNKDLWAPWCSDYHVNINIQMNYWPAEVCNLSETVDPLINFMKEITVPGALTAKNVYGAKGWTMHHTTDVFGKTSVLDGVYWGMFPLGGAWMTFPLWRHYEFTQDVDYLKEKAYPIMKGAAEFLQTFLIEDKEGYLVTAPSYSPENSYIDPRSGREFKLTYAPTMDIQIIREVFLNTRKAAEILGVDAEFSRSLQKTMDKLPPVRIGADGTIMEWIKDYKEFEPGHRHISHLLGLHPGTQITPETPDFFEGARKTLEKRLASGGGHTGWSRAWIINFYARLLDGEECYKHLRLLLEKSTLDNLWDTHPPFQIDGNFGGTAGIAEMLLQSHNGMVRILPALPSAWPEGKVSGLKARGNFEIGMEWKNGKLAKLIVVSLSGNPLLLNYNDQVVKMNTKVGQILTFNENLEQI